MTDPAPTIALVHASAASMGPAVEAFAQEFPQARLWHLLDDRLVTDADAAGGLIPPLAARMTTLIGYAVANGADAVQLSCSMYGPVAQQAAHPVPVLASDQAMFDAVLDADPTRVIVVGSLESAAHDSADRLREFLTTAGTTTQVVPLVVEGAAAAASDGDRDRLGQLIAAATAAVVTGGDLVVLAQYSLAPARAAVAEAVDVPVLSPPHMAATALRATLSGAAT